MISTIQTKTVVDAAEGITYIIDARTNKILSYADRYGNIYNENNKMVALAT